MCYNQPMNTQKLILTVLVLVVVLGLGFMVVKQRGIVPGSENEGPEEIFPEPADGGTNKSAEFGKAVAFGLNDRVIFSDGLNIELKDINDSRCPSGVQCIWAGEIVGIFTASGGALIAPTEIYLGTVNNKSIISKGYTFSLTSATKSGITIQVAKN